MASYNRLVENYERREKELNASLVAFYLQAGHLILSGKTNLKDDEYSRPYELIASEISAINEQCREISANEQRKVELEKSGQTLKKAIQEFEPQKRSRYIELGKYLFENYTQHLSSTFGSVYSALCEEKKAKDLLESNIQDIADQIERKDFFSKIVLRIKQSSLNTQLSVRQHKMDNLMAEGAEKAFRAGVVNTENGGTSYSACRILQEEIDSVNAKLEDTLSELAKVSEKLKEADKKNKLLAAAAEKAGELDKLAESAGSKLVDKYVSAEAVMLADFPESYARIFTGVVEIRRELCSIARRKEMLRCSEQIDNAVASMDAMNKEVAANKADIERLVKRNEELAERIASTAAAAESIKQRKIALEVEEGVSVNRLLGVVPEAADAGASDDTGANNTTGADDSASATETSSAEDVTVTATASVGEGETDAPASANKADAPKPKRTYKKRAPKTSESADGEKATTKKGKNQSKLKNKKTNGEASTSA